jgi:hypothetical protein
MFHTPLQIRQDIVKKLENHFGVTPETATQEQFYRAVAMMVQKF